MSLAAITWVQGLEIEYIKDTIDLMIMQCIADYCNENDRAVISYAEIGRYCRCSENTVRSRMKRLLAESFGYMIRTQPRSQTGRMEKSIFQLNRPKSPPTGDVGGSQKVQRNRQSRPPLGDVGGCKSPPIGDVGGSQKVQRNRQSQPPLGDVGGASGVYNKTLRVFYISPGPDEDLGKVVPGGKQFEEWEKHYLDIGSEVRANMFAVARREKRPMPVQNEWPPGYQLATTTDD